MPRGSFYIVLQGAVQYVVLFLAYVALTRILNLPEIGELPLLNVTYSVFSTITIFALGTATTKYVAIRWVGKRESGCRRRSDCAEDRCRTLGPRLPSSGFDLSANQRNHLRHGAKLSGSGARNLRSRNPKLRNDSGRSSLGLESFGQMVTANIVGVITSRVFGVLLATSPLRLEGYIIGWIIGNTSTLLIAFAYTRPLLRKTQEKIPVVTMLVYSYPILLSTLVALVQQWADVTILYGLTGSLIYTGVYYLGVSGAGILSPIATSITSAVLPTLSSMHGRVDSESFRGTLLIAERAMNGLVIPASFGLAAVAPIAVTVAYGRDYLTATLPFAIIVASTILVAYQSLMATVLQSIAQTQPLLRIALAAAATEIVLTAVLTVPLNVVGSALARLGMILVSMLVTYWCVKGEWWPSLDKQQLMKCLALSTVIAVVLFVFNAYLLSELAISSLSKLLLDAGVFVVVYICGLVILKPLHPEDVELLKAATPSRLHGLLKMLEGRIVQS